MDSITQASLGGLCGELTLRKQLGWKGTAWGIFFGTLPDLDILVYPWLDQMGRLSWHRGLSHSLLLCVVSALLFGWLLAKLHRKKGVSFKQASWFVFITWFTHVLIDCFTSYGTQALEPFSNHRVAFNNMSIIDISFTLPMLLGILLVLFFKRDSRIRTGIGRATALWLCLYTTASLTLKYQAEQHFEKLLNARGIQAERMMTAPTISNIFLWRMLAETEGQYHIAYWSFFDQADRPQTITSTPKGHEALKPFEPYPETERLIWFAKGWHKVVVDPTKPESLLFIDMRFTEMVTPESKRPVFVWSLTHEQDEMRFRQVSFREQAKASDTIDYLWLRLKGGAPQWMDAPWPWEHPQHDRTSSP